MRLIKSTVGAILCCLAFFPATAAAESLDLNLRLQSLEQAAPPEVFGEYLIFSYAALSPAYLVGARFSHENYRAFHTFSKNENDIYVLAVNAPEASQTIKYRYMVDGVWLADPANQRSERNEQGIVFSLFDYRKAERALPRSPRFLPDGYVELSFAMRSGESVCVAGDFNGYDPFSHRLKEVEPGLYRIRLKLLPGRHYYYFVVDGTAYIDMDNPHTVVDAERRQLSLLIIE